MKQMLFDFPRQEDYSPESFIPFSANREAVFALSQSQTSCAIYGLSGVGKTHLLKIWCAQNQAHYFTPQSLALSEISNLYAVAVDDVQCLDSAVQEKLFHIFNQLKKVDGSLVVASNLPLAQLDFLPDLKSRLLTLSQIEVGLPTDAELKLLLLKWAEDCQLRIESAVIAYILKYVERSPAKLRDLVFDLNARSLEKKQAVTIPLVRQLLQVAQ